MRGERPSDNCGSMRSRKAIDKGGLKAFQKKKEDEQDEFHIVKYEVKSAEQEAELERMMEERSRLRVAQIGFLQKREGEVGAAVMIQKLMRGHLARLKKKKAARPPQAAADAVPPRKNKFLAAAEEDFEEDYGQ